MTASKKGKAFLASLITLMLSACAMSEDNMARLLVAPGKFELYSCPELIEQARTDGKRRRELERLIAKAGQESSGRFVSAIAYQPDYLSVQGEMRDVRETAVAKNCDLLKIEQAAAEAPMGDGPSEVTAVMQPVSIGR